MANSSFTPTVQQSFTEASTLQAGIVTTGTQSFSGTKIFTNLLEVGGGIANGVRVVTSTSSLTNSDNIVIASPSSANITLTLPTHRLGQTLVIKRNSASYFVYLTSSSGTIDGSSTVTLSSNYQALTLVSDGTNWFIL